MFVSKLYPPNVMFAWEEEKQLNYTKYFRLLFT